jgi:AAA domain
MELEPSHSPDPYEISLEELGKLTGRLPEASFEHSEATLERHARNVERFLQAVQELIRQDKTARLYQAEAKTEPVANESWSEGHPASFLVKLKADRLLGQALDMGFERAYFIDGAHLDGATPVEKMPRDVPAEWVPLRSDVTSHRLEEDVYVFKQLEDGPPIAGKNGIIIGWPKSGNKVLEEFLLLLRDSAHRFPITVAIKLFNWLESDVVLSERLSRSDLNPDQNACLNMFVENMITMIQGPPGTGKSTTNAALIEHGVSEGKKILCCSNTHKAIDAIAEKLVDLEETGRSPILTELFREKRVTRYGLSTIPNKIRDILFSSKSAITGSAASLEKDKVSICTNYRVLGLDKIQIFDYVMVDEAGTVNLAYLYCVACLASEKIVICGDPAQLEPVFVYNRASALTRVLFERHIYRANKVRLGVHDVPDKRLAALSEQHRMPDELAELVRLTGLYQRYVTSASYKGPRREDASALACAPLGGHPLVILDTSLIGARYTTRANLQHQEVIKALVSHYLSTSHQMHIGVISPYRPQAQSVQMWLREHKIKKVTAGTVHQFQGSEFPLVIWDTVESPSSTAEAPSHRFTDDVRYPQDTINLLNVAVSRAKGKLIILANVDYLLRELSPGCYLHRVLEYAGRLHCIVPVAVALRRMGIELGQTEDAASYFSRNPAYVNCKDILFEQMFASDAGAARGEIAIYNRAADLGCLYELMGFLDPLAARNQISISMFLPRKVSRDVRDLVKDAYRKKAHFRFPHPKRWKYSPAAFAVFDNRLSYIIDPDLNPPSLANGEVPFGFTRYIS